MSLLEKLAAYDAARVREVFEEEACGPVRATVTGMRGVLSVERLYVDRPEPGVARAYLHRIPPPAAGTLPYVHSHGAPLAVRVLSCDAYELGLTWARGRQEDVPFRAVARGEFWYEMCDDAVQHYIWPHGVSYSIALLGEAGQAYRVRQPGVPATKNHDHELLEVVQTILERGLS